MAQDLLLLLYNLTITILIIINFMFVPSFVNKSPRVWRELSQEMRETDGEFVRR